MGEKREGNSPRPTAYCKLTLRSLVARAGGGSEDARENLTRFLERYPEARATIRELDDLADRALAEWVEAAADGNRLSEEALRAEMEALQAALLGPAPSALDRLLVSNLLVSHLANLHAARVAAWPGGSPAAATLRDRRAESAQRRLIRAVKIWVLIRGKSARGIAPPPDARLFAPAAGA